RPFHWLCKNTDCGGRNGYRFSVITRTIFEDTKVPLRLWFKVGYLMLTAKKGISALQVHRVIFGEESGSDHHTSWYMCHRWRAATHADLVRQAVIENVSLVATDEDHAYDYVRQDMPHEAVHHGAGEYVRGHVHTNNIESFWSLLKRGVMGTYHKMSKDYLPLY